MAASFAIKRRGIVKLDDPEPGTASTSSSRSCTLRTGISLSFDPSVTDHGAGLKIKLDAPVFLLNPEAKASLTKAQHINSTFNTPRRSTRLAVAIHIHSQHITSLTFSRSSLPDHLAPIYKRLAGDSVVALHLRLSAPPGLVVPNIPGSLIPSTRADLDIVRAFQQIADASTAGQTLTIYLPGTSLTDAQTSALSASISCPSHETLSEQPLDLQLNGLFGGLGGRLIPPNEVATFICPGSPTASPSSRSDARSPPGYEDLGVAAGDTLPAYEPEKQGEQAATAEAFKGRKRRRVNSPANQAISATKEATKSLGAALGVEEDDAHPLIHTLQQQISAAHSAIARLEALHTRSTEREAALSEREAALDEQIALADEKLAALNEASTVEYSETTQQEGYINECMGELRQELVELLDDRLEAFGLDVPERAEVEEMVEAHVNAAVVDLKERLAGGRVVITFPE